MLKRNVPMSEAEQENAIIKKLRQSNCLTGNDRKWLIKKLEQEIESQCHIEGCDPLLTKQKNKRIQVEIDPPVLSPSNIQNHTKNVKHAAKSDLMTKEELKSIPDLLLSEEIAEIINDTEMADLEASSTESSIQYGDYEDQIQKMKLMAESGEIDKSKAKELMDCTFEQRKSLIKVQMPLVAQVRETYPLLFTFNEVKHELDRHLGEGKCELFLRNIAKYSKTILNKSENSSSKKDILNYMKEAEAEEDRRIIRQTGSVLLFPLLFKDKDLDETDFVVYCDQTSTDLPYIHAPSKQDMIINAKTMKVIVEGNELCEHVTFLEAVLCMMSCFFIFNICYPDQYNSTMVGMEKLFLEAKDTTDIPKHVKRMIDILKSSVKG